MLNASLQVIQLVYSHPHIYMNINTENMAKMIVRRSKLWEDVAACEIHCKINLDKLVHWSLKIYEAFGVCVCVFFCTE